MARDQTRLDGVAELDRWHSEHCDGTWEHRYGVRIQTTDNPGWLLEFNSLPLNQKSVPMIAQNLLRDYGAEVVVVGTEVKVFCRSLRGCLAAAVDLLKLENKKSQPGR
jgi:hypothetical protein